MKGDTCRCIHSFRTRRGQYLVLCVEVDMHVHSKNGQIFKSLDFF